MKIERVKSGGASDIAAPGYVVDGYPVPQAQVHALIRKGMETRQKQCASLIEPGDPQLGEWLLTRPILATDIEAAIGEGE